MKTSHAGPADTRLPVRTALAAATLAVGAFLAGRLTSGPPDAVIVRGTVERVGPDGVGVRLADRDDPDAVYFIGTGHTWTDVEGSGHGTGQPECLPPESRGAVVELGVLPEVAGGYRNHVVWVRCVTLPTGFVVEDVVPPPLDDAYRQALERE